MVCLTVCSEEGLLYLQKVIKRGVGISINTLGGGWKRHTSEKKRRKCVRFLWRGQGRVCKR